MCRLAYIPKPFRGMSEWLASLEKSAGGDGNGIAVGERAIKGVKVTIEQTVEAFHDLQPGNHTCIQRVRISRGKRRRQRKAPTLPALWHSRRTSSGGQHDDLCHPHPCDGGWLAHNGHWQWAHAESLKINGFGPMSDTRLFSMVIDRDGFEKATAEHQPPGVWLHMKYDGSLAVYVGSGDLWYCPGLRVYGSEPAKVGGKWYEVARGWTSYGKRPRERKVVITSARPSPTPLSSGYLYSEEDDPTTKDFGSYYGWWR